MNKIVGGKSVGWWTDFLSQTFGLTAPRPGSLLVCATAAQKPALKGEVAMSDSELTEGLHRGCSFFPQPLSRLAATAPRPGSLLVCATTNPKACPERGGGNERQRIDGGVATELLIFSVNPSVTANAVPAPRPGSLLVCATANPKAVPASGESGTKCQKWCGLGGGFRVSESRRGQNPSLLFVPYIFPSFSSSQRFFTRKVATWLPWLPRPKPSSAPLARACAEAT